MKKILFTLSVFVLSICSCTNLDETVYSSIPSDKFFTTEEEFLMSAGRVYSHLLGYTHYYNIWGTITVSTDEALSPLRQFNQWVDGGVWRDLHAHTFTPAHDNIRQTWDFLFQGISLCNQILYEFSQAKLDFSVKESMIAEIKVMRAWFYFNAMDLFGNVPLTIDFTDVSVPSQKDRTEIFAFIEKEIKDNVDLLADAPSENYGRATKPFAYTILAKMYLNAEKWFGTPKWEETIDACDAVINLHTLQLESDFFTNFKVNNQNSKENIFVIVYDKVYANGGDWGWALRFRFHQLTLHWESTRTFGIIDETWNGFCTSQSFFETFDLVNDYRSKTWLYGPQVDASGAPLLWYGTQVDFTPQINSLFDESNPAYHNQGVRFAKYEYENGLQGECMSNDYVVYRYADILMMKGEALVRNNQASLALPLFNEVRIRAGLPPYQTNDLTLDEIYAERGREFVWEGSRRQDMIRFGKWTAARDFKATETDNHTELFPIPARAMTNNPNLKQNSGYIN
ncbi:MAG: RagB/SusD family nutrient uptake outer membrane protein [Proteiniphilum sp.]|jgi:hypothetical protein|uniref:RagB/SusD family nutrient uptake outer membrane protein n=1 Tax=Proteiniphilum sp. TaxID=1926877 RepID=UPI002B213D1D|nr:RagB/SusD family nutrient uptake outer membrane protein [Proteiniphilum sp.]MEA5128352.1 RagB/SusD family nutrient uptake outer membrane protein [Proteiniphilum sp.]